MISKNYDYYTSLWFCRQAALEALQVVLEAFSQEDHFEAVAGPLLGTPLQHTQAASSSTQVSHPTLVSGGQGFKSQTQQSLSCLHHLVGMVT